MAFVGSTLLDPQIENAYFFRRQRSVTIRRRHLVAFVGTVDARVQFARFQFARHDREVTAQICKQIFFAVGPEIGILVFGIRAMAMKTLVRQDWADLVAEVDCFFAMQNACRATHHGDN